MSSGKTLQGCDDAGAVLVEVGTESLCFATRVKMDKIVCAETLCKSCCLCCEDLLMRQEDRDAGILLDIRAA